MENYEARAQTFEEALLSVDRLEAQNLISKELKTCTPFEIIEKIIAPALENLGTKWEMGEIALSQEYMAGKISEELMIKILPENSLSRITSPRLGITTLGDYHLLGKRMVASFLRTAGFTLLDFGPIEPEKLVERLKEEKIDILLVSILMLNLTSKVRKLRTLLEEEGLGMKIIVSGAPFKFDPLLYKNVGANAMVPDTSELISTINRLAGKKT